MALVFKGGCCWSFPHRSAAGTRVLGLRDRARTRLQCHSDVCLTVSVHMFLICMCNNDISSCRGGIFVSFGCLCSAVPKDMHRDVIVYINKEIGEGVSGLAMST